MKRRNFVISALFILSCFLLTFAQTPVERHGSLQVSGNKIIGEHGNPVQLRGMSLYWSVWGGEDFFTDIAITDLANNWKVDLVRAPIAARRRNPYGLIGYTVEMFRDTQLERMRTVVNAAIQKGIYVIVDFHAYDETGETEEILEGAKNFFTTVATEFGDHPNIIYEILNEPIGPANGEADYWADYIKPYHEEVIATIRQIDPDNLIIAGTPRWCQRSDIAAANPLTDNNLAYTLHFYAASHGNDQRGWAQDALDAGVALFATEWGTVQENGNGDMHVGNTRNWLAFMDQNQISWANWNLCNKNETASALVTTAEPNGNWSDAELTESGKFIRDTLLAYHAANVSVTDRQIHSRSGVISLKTTHRGIKLSLPQQHQFISYQLFRMNGKIAAKGKLEGKTELRLAELPKGMWFVRLVGKTQTEVIPAAISR